MHKTIQYMLVFVGMAILISIAPAQDAFDKTVAMYKERMAKLDVTVSEHRLKLLKESIEADQIEHARLHREQIPSSDVTVTLGTYGANSEFFPIAIETSTERFTERLSINRNDARILYENWDKVRIKT